MIWRVDHSILGTFRPQETEFYASKDAAMSRERDLLKVTRNAVAWEDYESTGPFVPEAEAVA